MGKIIVMVWVGADMDRLLGGTGAIIRKKTHMQTIVDGSNPYFSSISEHM